ncbi:MAG: HAD family hydrolase [Simkaniaceae bacterium]|nr:HAD family hydrolase [Candidatus Sacchlamyda saccharinae]
MIFDLDDTLIETSKCLTPYYLRSCFSAMQGAGSAGSLDDLIQLNEKALTLTAALEEFCGGKKEIYQAGLSALNQPLPKNISIDLLPGALEVLDELQAVHTLALVTKGNPQFQRLKMEKAGIQPERFSKLVIGNGPSKKSDYQMVLSDLKIDPSEALVCGDRVSVDLSPAKELGMFTVHIRNGRGEFHDGPMEHVDFAINDLKQLYEVFEIA